MSLVRRLTRWLGVARRPREGATSNLDLVGGRKLVVVSNRAPVHHCRQADGSIVARAFAGGLTTALEPVLRAASGCWVAHGGGSADFEVTDRRDGVQLDGYRLRRVRLDDETYDAFYNGYANGALWPLFHYAYAEPVFRSGEWEAYVRANEAFRDAVLDEIGDEPALVIVNDYHLTLLPRMLKESGRDVVVALFWHIPWPGRRLLRVCPHQEEIFHGILGADLVGFHSKEHVVNFLDTMDRTLEACVDVEHRTVMRGGHRTWARDLPISIDVGEAREGGRSGSWEATFPEIALQVEGRLLMLGVDRLDYTKGIPHRLQIFGKLLEMRPELRGQIVFVQIGAPSRFQIDSYRRLAVSVRERAAEINAAYGTEDWTPVHLVEESHERADLFRLYRRADIMMVTSLHDGMNLVAKEYVAAKAGEEGILVLSRFTGAADEFAEACLINPFDIDGAAQSLLQAIDLASEERIGRMQRLYEHLERADVYHWAKRLLADMREVIDRKSIVLRNQELASRIF